MRNNASFNLVFLIAIAFCFSMAVRLIWVYQFYDFEQFKFAGQFMINTNDGYYWAEGARDLVSGVYQENDLSPIKEAPSWLTYVLTKFLPVSFETVIFYMSAFIGSLVVVPMLLIAHNLKMLEVGFLSALLGSIAVSYYNRTMVGYYDTDMLNIVFPVLLLWSLILAFQTKEQKYLLITAFEIIAYRWWYPQSYSLEFAFFGLIVGYILLFDRKNIFYIQLLSIMLFAMMGLPSFVRLVLVIMLFGVFRKTEWSRYAWHILGLAIVLFFASGGFSPIWAHLKGYVFKDVIETTKDPFGLQFFSVMQTIREAGQIDFVTFAERISGHTITFVGSLVGYALMVRKYPVMLLALPLLGLGFLALWGGLRFTIYAVPVCAFGVAYLLFTCSAYIQKVFVNERIGSSVKSSFVILASLGILYPNILHVINYRVPTVFNATEVEQLDRLKQYVDREDYIISWWDYGYPLRYYVDAKTLIDGGKHSGEVNFPVSYMLTFSQESAAKLARFEVEYTEMAFALQDKHEKKFFEDAPKIFNNTTRMTLDAGFKDANDFLDALSSDIKLPPKTRDVYFYLPYRMMGIFPTVAQFSNLDIMSGKTVRQPFFYQSNRFQDSAKELNLGSGVIVDKTKGTLLLGKQEVPLKRFVKTGYTPEKKLVVEQNAMHPNGQMSVVYMQAYNTFLVLDEAMFNSSYIQLFVLENYDANFYEPVILEPHAKVFKLKI